MANKAAADKPKIEIDYCWYGLQHHMLEDKSYLVIAAKCAVDAAVVAMLWLLLYRHANANDPRGSIKGYDADELGIFYGMDGEKVEEIITQFRARGMIDGRNRVADFHITQDFKQAQKSTKRVREFRQRQKEKKKQQAKTKDETFHETQKAFHETDGNVSETLKIDKEKRVKNKKLHKKDEASVSRNSGLDAETESEERETIAAKGNAREILNPTTAPMKEEEAKAGGGRGDPPLAFTSGAEIAMARQGGESGDFADPPSPTPPDDRSVAQMLIDIWREILPSNPARDLNGATGYPKKLAKHFRLQFAGDPQAFRDYCESIAGRSFLTGAGDQGWQIDLDYAMRPTTIADIKGGKYRTAKDAERERLRGLADARTAAAIDPKSVSDAPDIWLDRWKDFHSYIHDEIGQTHWRSWFSGLALEDRDGEPVIVAGTRFGREWLRQNYQELIAEAVDLALDREAIEIIWRENNNSRGDENAGRGRVTH